MNQLGLFDAPAPTPKAAKPAAAPIKRQQPTRKGHGGKSKAEPVAPAVVVADPQLPPLGAVAKINGHWHQWRKGSIGGIVGWEIIRPEHHAAHASDQPPRLGSNNWISEPFPAEAIVHLEGHALRFRWSEYGFAVYHGDKHLLHFSEVAGCAVAAAEIARRNDTLKAMLTKLDTPAPVMSREQQLDEGYSLDGTTDQPEEWRFEWRGLSVIGTKGPCFQIDKAKHPEGTPCWSSTGFRSFCGDAWRLAGTADARSTVDWSIAILDAYFAAPAKDGNGLGGKLVPWKRHDWEIAEEAEDDEEPMPAPAGPSDEPPPYHPLVEQLLRDGVLEAYSLGFGYHQRDPKHGEREAPWNAPSRLFQFPCTLIAERGGTEPPRLVVEHQRLLDHPFVQELVAAGLQPEVKEGKAYGTYHHAVDLISAGKWRLLLDLRDFSSADDFLSAINYGLDYGHLSAKDAATVLRTIGLPMPNEPTSPLHALRAVQFRESPDEKGKKRRTVNWMLGPGHLANTWGNIVARERGWLQVEKGFTRWTDKAVIEQRNLKAAAGEAVAPAPVPEGCLL